MGSNDSDNKKYIISVESRKGGVGKTTAALWLAELLLKKEYAVLFLDLDITGTDASDIENSPVWKKILNIIKVADPETDKNEPVNLIKLFHYGFMSGKGFMSEKLPQEIGYKVDKINMLGSQIYNYNITQESEQDNQQKNKRKNDSVTCIEKPGVLFDELHGYWLLEFVESVINKFQSFVNQQKNIAVILDNSPGYMGLSPIIHEWMTDNGPEFNKFLIVSSLDRQDLRACEMSVNKLHKLLKDKREAGDLYKELSKPKAVIDIKKIKKHKKLLMQLAASDKSSVLHKNYIEQNSNIQEFCKIPALYMATIINKVPEEDYEMAEKEQFKYQDSNSQSAFKSSLSIGEQSGSINASRMIPYISGIERQFNSIVYERLQALQARDDVKSLLKGKDEYLSLLKKPSKDFEKGRVAALIKKYDILLKEALGIVFWQTSFQDLEKEMDLIIRKNWLLDKTLSYLGETFPTSLDIIQSQKKPEYIVRGSDEFLNLIENSMDLILSYNLEYAWFFERMQSYEWKHLIKELIKSPEDLFREISSIYVTIFHSEFDIKHKLSQENLDEIREYCARVTKAQVQILDYANDVEFILYFLEFLSMIDKEDKRSEYKKCLKIGNEVIVNRSFSHAEAKKKLEYNPYKKFESVLSDVIKKWEIKQ